MNNFINNIEEKGNLFIDKILIPFIKNGKNILKDNEIVKGFLGFRTELIKNKLSQYIEFINKNQEEEIIDFIENLSSEEKTFFIETINKVIDLDDSLQIYIMAYLTKQFKENNELNYYEKQLFYNINTFLEDDFKIYFCMYKQNISEYIKYMDIKYYYKNEEIIEISLNKFSNIGLLKNTSSFSTDKEKISSSTYYYTTDYSEQLFKCLNIYFDNFSCDCNKLLEKRESTHCQVKLTGI